MRRTTQKAIKVLYYLTWPASAVMLHNSRRTRTLVISDDHILLQRGLFGNQRWGLPGGGVKNDENPLKGAVRELEEETGVVINEERLQFIGEDRLPRDKPWPKSDLLFYVVNLPKRSEIKITRPLEILEVGWFKLDRLPQDCGASIRIGLDMLKKYKKQKLD